MTVLEFDGLLDKVYSWWPSCINLPGKSSNASMSLGEIEDFYDSQVAPLAQASGSRLLIQLDWIVYGAICAALKISSVVRLDELRRDYIEERFHGLLLSVGVRQLNGVEEPDGSFDLVELAAYLELVGLNRARMPGSGL